MKIKNIAVGKIVENVFTLTIGEVVQTEGVYERDSDRDGSRIIVIKSSSSSAHTSLMLYYHATVGSLAPYSGHASHHKYRATGETVHFGVGS